jgi:hypothetical protein
MEKSQRKYTCTYLKILEILKMKDKSVKCKRHFMDYAKLLEYGTLG